MWFSNAGHLRPLPVTVFYRVEFYINLQSRLQLCKQSPGEIKRREVSWTLTRKLAPEEVKSREVVLG